MTESSSRHKPKWYKVGSWDDLEQGDLLPDCPVLLPPDDFAARLRNAIPGEPIQLESQIGFANLIVASQSCDLQNEGKIENVVLCAYHDASQYPRNIQTEIQSGRRPAYYMLEPCDIAKHRFKHQIVELRAIYSLPLAVIHDYAKSLGDRIRVRSPYKEDFSQSLANFFMRVARPRSVTPIPRENKK